MDEKAIKLFQSIFLSYRLSPIHLLIRIIFDLLERFRTYEIFSEQLTNKRQTCIRQSEKKSLVIKRINAVV